MGGKTFRAKVVQVYDGDTIRIQFRHRGEIQQWRVRMSGYDSPEMKPKLKSPHREEEMRLAVQARDALLDLVEGQPTYFVCDDWDKYGRLLGTLYCANGGCCGFPCGTGYGCTGTPCCGGGSGLCCGSPVNVNAWMVQNNHGLPYDGGTKREWSDVIRQKLGEGTSGGAGGEPSSLDSSSPLV